MVSAIQADMQLMACSPIKAEVQFGLNSFHHFPFTHYTLAMSVHTTARTNHKFYVLSMHT